MDLTEAEDIKKRWQEYTEELYKKDLHDPDNHNGMTTHLEPDILECEVKWALESITTNKASGGDGIPVDLFQILKDDAKEWSNNHTITLMSYANKVMLKILQARLQQYVNKELPDVQADVEKAEETEIKLPTSVGS